MRVRRVVQVVASLKKSKHLATLSEVEIKQVLQSAEEATFAAGDVIAAANGPVTNKVFLVKSGEVVLVPADVPLPGESAPRGMTGMERAPSA